MSVTKPTQTTEFNRHVGWRRQVITMLRIVRSGSRNLLRNAWLSIAAIAVMFVALTIILSGVVLNVATNNAIKELSKNLKASIYLKDDVSEDSSRALETALQGSPYSESVTFISKDQAREGFTASFQNDPELLEGLTLVGADSLPASYEVSVSDLSKMPEIEKIAKDSQFETAVDSISLGKTNSQNTITRAAGIQRFVTRASIVAGGIFTIVSVLIIFNTIRMAIYTRSEEIRIMKLIGATPGYIRGPFLVEASIYGVIAGVIAASSVYSFIFSIGPTLVGTSANLVYFGETYNFFTEPSMVLAAFFGCILAGVLVGILSSTLAMEKHLKLRHW